MYRVVGCILIVAAGAGMGFSESFRFSERIRTLEMLLQLVETYYYEDVDEDAMLENAAGTHHCRMPFMVQPEG